MGSELRIAPAAVPGALLVDDTDAHTGRLAARGADGHDVGQVDGGLDGGDAALAPLPGHPGPLVLGHPVDTLDHHALGLRVDADDPPLLAGVLAGDHPDGVVALHAVHGYSTSGASETIFMKRLSRSSR